MEREKSLCKTDNDFSRTVLFDETEDGQQDDDHKERYDHHGQQLFVKIDMTELAVVCDFLFKILKAPYLGYVDADKDTADGHQQIGGEGVEPVVDAKSLKSACVYPGELHIT